MLQEGFNRTTLKNRLLVTKKLHNFKMESGTRFATHVDRFKEIVLQMEMIGEPLDGTRRLVLLLDSLIDEYRMLSTVLENTPTMTLSHAIQTFRVFEASDESSSAQEKAFATKKKENFKHRFNGKCFYCKKTDHKEVECREKDAGASLSMTSVRDKFVSTASRFRRARRLPQLQRALVEWSWWKEHLSCCWMCCTSLKLMEASSSKLAEKDIVAQFSNGVCVFRYGGSTVVEAKSFGNVYKVEDGGMGREASAECWRTGSGAYGHIRSDADQDPGGCATGVTLIDANARHVTVYFMKVKPEVLSKFKIFKAAMENPPGETIQRLHSDNSGEYMGKPFTAYLDQSGITSTAKFDDKAFKRQFVGYDVGVKGHRVLNLATGKVQIVRTMTFTEQHI
ncbi:hypothetical protein ON010_g4024 [Phytophthora cinnamomi]|nr:hypothetical protein ON010_g4024 [Phytophthora cinnamomi]